MSDLSPAHGSSSEAELKEAKFVGTLHAIDDYLAACTQLTAALKGGWFSLARAKYAGAPGASLGQAAYPGDMRASAVVSVVEPSDPDDLFDRFELQRAADGPSVSSDAGAAPETSGGGRDRGRDAAADRSNASEAAAADGQVPAAGPSATGSGRGSKAAADPLQWFGGGLPPADLRQAQRDFQGALAAAVAAANQLQRLRGLADALLDGGSAAGSADEAEGAAEQPAARGGGRVLLRGALLQP
jgi:hypothetical protein